MELQDLNALRSVDELVAYRAQLDARSAELDKEFSGLPFSDEAQAEFDAIRDQRTELDARVAELAARHDYLNTIAADESRQERVGDMRRAPGARVGSRLPDNVFDLAAYRQSARSEADYGALLADGARRVVDLAVYPHPRADQDKVKADIIGLFARVDDPDALARHIVQTGSPQYARAFGKGLLGQPLSHEEMGALSLGTDSAGGFAVPFQLDPTLIATSDGAINPLRQISRVERITGKEWQGVTATGVTVTRTTENAQADDGSPVLAQPAIRTNRVHGFVPFSVELGLAWGSLQSEIARLLQDAKDEEEADSFINGDGTGVEPGGLVGTMPDTSVIVTGDASFGPEDVYRLKNALPPRFRARGRFLGEGGIYDEVRQFDENGGSNMWVQLSDGRPAILIGYPNHEMSTMDGAIVDAADILVFGDFNHFIIVDRIGMTVELIPHLFGANQRPTGQRGIYAHWHNNAEILVPNAFRLLRVGTDLS